MAMNKYQVGEESSQLEHIKLLYISKSNFEQDWNSFVHTHYFTELFYITGGEGYFVLDDKKFMVREHDIVVINPHVTHTELSKDGHAMSYIVLGVEGVKFTFEADNTSRGYGIYSNLAVQHNILFYFGQLLHEAENKQQYCDILCKNILEILVIHIMRTFRFYTFNSIYQDETIECSKIKSYIDNNFMAKITLEQLAEIAHINKFYLVHRFTKAYGLSPINYLIEKKIQGCQELLETTDYSVLQISQTAGFSSQSYFSQTYKRLRGTSPAAYRKSVQLNKGK